MAKQNKQQANADAPTVGYVLQQARLEAGYTIKVLAQMAGVQASQIAKLEHDQVQKPNPGHLAALAGPLGLSVYTLYKAAGYPTPAAISSLAPHLEDALRRMPEDTLAKVEHYIEQLTRPPEPTGPQPEADEFLGV